MIWNCKPKIRNGIMKLLDEGREHHYKVLRFVENMEPNNLEEAQALQDLLQEVNPVHKNYELSHGYDERWKEALDSLTWIENAMKRAKS